jgi:hypothetical protein
MKRPLYFNKEKREKTRRKKFHQSPTTAPSYICMVPTKREQQGVLNTALKGII